MATNANYDTLSIKIEADSSKASANIAKMTKGLTDLESLAKKLDFSQIAKVQKVLQDISKIDFSNVSRGLDSVVKSFNKLNNISSKSKGKSDEGLTGMLNNVPSTATTDIALPSFTALTDTTKTFEGFNTVISSTVGHLQAVKQEMNKTEKATETVNKTVPKAIVNFEKLATQFARIVRYRIIRKIIQDIYKSINEGIKRIAEFDEATNQALSEIKTSFSYLKSALGSALAPLIKAITPLLTAIVDIVADLFNALGSLFSIITGNEIIKATKEWEDFNNALKDTKSIGIDELNVIGEQAKTYYIKVEGVEELNEVLDSTQKLGVAIAVIGGLASVWTALKSGIIAVNLAFTKLQMTLAVGVLGGLIAIVSAIMDIVNNGANAGNVLTAVVGGLAVAVSGFFLMLETRVGSAIIAINGLRTALLSVGIAMGVLVAGAMLFATLFKEVKAGWGQMNFWQKLASVVGLVLVAVGTLVAVVSAFLQQWHVFAIAVAGIAVGTGMTIGAYKSADIPQYATGGFPEDGLFFANHNELVGTFEGGKTAVANNEEITNGIYEAVLQAMRESGGNNIILEMDGQKMAKAITNRQRNFGDRVMYGGAISYGK